VLRAVVAGICVAGIVGMIVGSAADNNNGVVITFGLITAAGVVVLMAVTAATRQASPPEEFDEVLAARVEDRIQALLANGADERDVRALVRDAVRLGRSTRSRRSDVPADQANKPSPR
jgi:hypothetical protein